jgi:hypothetical protein
MSTFSFNEDVAEFDSFNFSIDAVNGEPKLINSRVRKEEDGPLFSFTSDVDLSDECTSDGISIAEIMSIR